MLKKTIGDLLREARNKKGLALQTIERQTGIATHNLLAIELDQFSLIDQDRLEEYLRSYADAVGFDYNELSRLVDEQLGRPSVTEPVSNYDDLFEQPEPVAEEEDYLLPARNSRTSGSRTSRRSSRSDKLDQEFSDFQPEKKKSILPGLLMTLATLVLLAGACYWLYLKFLANPQAKDKPAEPTTEVSSAPAAETPAETPAAAQLTVTGAPDATQVVVTNASAQPLAVEVSLSGAESTWLDLTPSEIPDGGIYLTVDQSTYTAHFPEGVTEGVLQLGTVQGVTVKIDGQPLDVTTTNGYITIKVQ